MISVAPERGPLPLIAEFPIAVYSRELAGNYVTGRPTFGASWPPPWTWSARGVSGWMGWFGAAHVCVAKKRKTYFTHSH